MAMKANVPFLYILPKSSSAKHRRKLQICECVLAHTWCSSVIQRIPKWGTLGCHGEKHTQYCKNLMSGSASEHRVKTRVNFINRGNNLHLF